MNKILEKKEQVKKISHDNKFTEGSIIKSIIVLSVPIIIGNLLQAAYQITDAFWVGRLGADAVASVSISFPITFLIIALAGGIGLAGGVLVSQYKGREEHEKVNHISGQTFLMAFIASLILSIIGYIFTPQIISLFSPEPAVFNNAISFLRISFLGIVFVFGYAVYQALSRGVGEAKIPVYIISVSVLLNFILDPLFIYGYKFIPAIGVGGAAMATLFTQAIALFAGLFIMSRGKRGIHLKLIHFKPDYTLIKKILFLGFPISLEQSSRSIGFIMMSGLAASFGTVVLASYGIGTTVIGIVIVPALSLAIANSALVGQNIGAGKIERAEKIAKTSMIIGFIFLTIIGAIFFIFSTSIVSVFISNDPEVIRQGSLFLRIVAFSFGLVGIQMAILGTLRGSGNAKTTLFISASVIIIQILFGYLLSKYILHSQIGIWLAFPIANFFGAAIALSIFLRGKWKDKKLIETPKMHKNIEEECKIAECEIDEI